MTIQSRLTSDVLTGNVIVRRVVHGILAASALAALSVSAPALAQQAPAPADQELKEIVVTGSLLRRVDIESPSPVTIMTAEDIQKTGLTTIADVVRTLSADNSGTLPTAFGNAFAAGASGVALRGLTVNSTLVLIDGRRAANYALADDGERGFVDLNTIPLAAVDRIEVLKDGASSIYGADAIAGVVNVITKKSYQGGEVSAEIGKAQHAGAAARGAFRPSPAPATCRPTSTMPTLHWNSSRTTGSWSATARSRLTPMTCHRSADSTNWLAPPDRVLIPPPRRLRQRPLRQAQQVRPC